MGLLALIVLCADGKFRGSWVWTDVFVAGVALTQMVSYYCQRRIHAHDGGRGSDQMGAAVYLFGRVALQSLDDLERLHEVVRLGLSGSIAVGNRGIDYPSEPVAMLSSYTGSSQSNLDVRWGLRRVEGPTFHPIFFGLLLVLLLPWALAAARRARSGNGPLWWMALPWLVGVSICLTMSRGPQLAMLLTLVIAFFFRFPPRARIWITTAFGTLAISILGSSFLLQALHAWSNEAGQEKQKVSIQGELYEYSGTNHRLLQLKVYENLHMHTPEAAAVDLFLTGLRQGRKGRPELSRVEGLVFRCDTDGEDNFRSLQNKERDGHEHHG